MMKYWWEEKSKDKIHELLHPYLTTLKSRQEYRSNDNLMFMKLHGNFDFYGLGTYGYSRAEGSNLPRLTLNVIESMVSTVVSKITKNKPKPYFLTSGGDWKLQQKAKKLNKFCEGLFYSTKLYEEMSMAFMDSCIFGTGAVKYYIQNSNVVAERVFIDEIMVDDSEAIYGKPRQMHHRKYIHKEVLKKMFPGFDAQIESSTKAEKQNSIGNQDPEMIQVYESWHLRSSDKSKDGRRTITISTATLFEERYDEDFFPFTFIKWDIKPLGMWGKGISEQLMGIQLEINKLLKTIQQSMHLVSIPKILMEASSKIVSSHLDNKIGGIITYAGTPPAYQALGQVPQELFSQLENLYNKAYEIVGISQLSAQSVKPGGLDSGKALREYNDIESERFLAVSRRYEEAFLDAGRIMIHLVQKCFEEAGDFAVKLKGKKFLETIKWSEIDLQNDQYMMQSFPTSSFSSSPSARFQEIQEFIQAGFLSKEDGRKLLNFPDLESVNDLDTAAVEDIDCTIDKMLEEGQYSTPEPYQNLSYGILKCQQAYLYNKNQNAPEDRLELLRTWIEDAQALLVSMTQTPPAPQNQEVAVEPQAVPEAPPVSEMIPNVPV